MSATKLSSKRKDFDLLTNLITREIENGEDIVFFRRVDGKTFTPLKDMLIKGVFLPPGTGVRVALLSLGVLTQKDGV
jgi:hypothetical protein